MPAERTLHLSGTIAEESWFDDDVTPQLFREELMSGSGDITVWINSPGGDCVAAAQIYNSLRRSRGRYPATQVRPAGRRKPAGAGRSSEPESEAAQWEYKENLSILAAGSFRVFQARARPARTAAG